MICDLTHKRNHLGFPPPEVSIHFRRQYKLGIEFLEDGQADDLSPVQHHVPALSLRFLERRELSRVELRPRLFDK